MSEQPEKKTVTCPSCGREVALTSERKIWKHRVTGSGPPGTRPFCDGSGRDWP